VSDIARFLTRRVHEARTPGAAWWVEAGGSVVDRGAVGRCTLDATAEAVGLATPFDLASLTKPLATALLLVLLEQDGAIDLDAPAAAWLEAFDGSSWSRTTLLDLAVHRSGLPAWRPLFGSAPDIAERIASIAREQPVAAGTTLYSDLGYIVLGAVIERVTESRLDTAFADRIAGPLGRTRLGFARDGRGFEDAAATEHGNAYERALAGCAAADHPWRSHVLRGEAHDANAWSLGGVAGHAGLFGTVEDVAAVAREIVKPAALPLGPAAQRRLLEPVGPQFDRTVGFVVARAAAAARGVLPVGARGHAGFTGTSLWIDVASRALFVLLSNRVHPRVEPRGFDSVRRAFHRLAVRGARRSRLVE
jgi:CubicO group peptidase (beta-lactamase class C family)